MSGVAGVESRRRAFSSPDWDALQVTGLVALRLLIAQALRDDQAARDLGQDELPRELILFLS